MSAIKLYIFYKYIMFMYILWELRVILPSIYAMCDNQVKHTGVSFTS